MGAGGGGWESKKLREEMIWLLQEPMQRNTAVQGGRVGIEEHTN